jgi:uncharacterized protein
LFNPKPEGNPLDNQLALIQEVLAGYPLPLDGIHGIAHWARVLDTGLRIAQANRGDQEVVTLFAIFHDSRRVNEHQDRGHGLRGGDLARSLRGTLIHLNDDRFERFHEASRLHTDGTTTGDPTIGACWDADRLDLGRIGIEPDSRLLSTDPGRGLVAWAQRRAVRQYEPLKILRSWGYLPSSEECR